MKLISVFRTGIRVLVTSGLFILLLAGCYGMNEQEKWEAATFATAYARDPSFVPPAKYQTIAATALGMHFNVPAATPTPNPNWTPTMSFMDFSGTQVAQQQAIGLTSQANQLQMERERLAAEAAAARAATQAYYAEVTAEAYRIEVTAQARATYMQGTANAEGTLVMNTAQAAATATTDMQIRIDATANAANAATAQVLPTHAIWTQNAVHAIQTIEQGEADKVELAVRRQKMKNGFDALLPWTLTVGAIIVIAKGFGEWVKTRVHNRDEHGRVPLIQMKTDSGDMIVIKPELMEASTMKIQRDGAVVRYEPMDAQEQSDINRRAAAVEAIAALPTPYAQTGAKILTSEFNSSRARVTIGDPRSAPSILDEADQGFLEEAKND
jgi:hypothetical protein